MSDKTETEAVAVFHDARSLQSAADTLLISGFDRADLSLLARREAVEKELGHLYSSVTELEDDSHVKTRAYAGEDSLTEAKTAAVGGLFFVGAVAAAGAVVASGGTMAAAIIGALAAGGTGGAIGAALAGFVGRRHADALQGHLDKGGLLLWVRTVDSAQEQRALKILKDNAGEDVHLHALPQLVFGDKLQIYGYLDWLAGEPRPTEDGAAPRPS